MSFANTIPAKSLGRTNERTEEGHAILESAVRIRRKRGGAQILSSSIDGIQALNSKQFAACKASAAGGDKRRELLLHETDEREDADGYRDDRWRTSSRLHRVVRSELPQGESRGRAESADSETLHQVPVQAGRARGVAL